MRNGCVDTCDGEHFPIEAILKRRNVTEVGDVPLAQLGASNWSMTSMISIMERDPSPESIKSLSKSIVDTFNKYSSQKKNNMFKFTYCGEITEGVSNNKLEALDHYCITKDIVSFVKSYYEEEINDRSFFDGDTFCSAYFGRKENICNLEDTIERFN